MHVEMEVLVDGIVRGDGCHATPHARNTGRPLNEKNDRQMERQEQREREPVHRNVVFLLAFLPLVRRLLVFVALVMHERMRLEGRLDVLGEWNRYLWKAHSKKLP